MADRAARVNAHIKNRPGLLWSAKCRIHRFMIRLQLPPYTCCGKQFPSSSWSQDCDTSSSGGSNGDIRASLYTAHLPSCPARWDSCQRARLYKEDGSVNENTQKHIHDARRQSTRLTAVHFKLTQFMLGKDKKRIVLIHILVELYGEFTYKLGSSFYFLGKKKEAEWLVEKESQVRKNKTNFQDVTGIFKN